VPVQNPHGGIRITTGTYNGDDTVNRAIPHNLGAVPYFVQIRGQSTGLQHWVMYADTNAIAKLASGSFTNLAVTAKDSTNFYVGNATSYQNSANASGTGHRWVAFG
jgi:hypothetical protein